MRSHLSPVDIVTLAVWILMANHSHRLNKEGQLGNGTRQNANVPQQINLPDRVIQIASGFQHTAFLSENHSLFVCGSNEFGQLGLENEQQHVDPVCVPVP